MSIYVRYIGSLHLNINICYSEVSYNICLTFDVEIPFTVLLWLEKESSGNIVETYFYYNEFLNDTQQKEFQR